MSKAAELAALIGSGQAQGDKNLIINGAMAVAQRGTSVSSVTSSGYNSLDRHNINISSAGTWTISQSTTAPTGFSTSMKFDCTTADGSLSASDYLFFEHKIEAQNLQQLSYGTSSAKNLTLSFYVRSNKTGTYVVEFQHGDAGSNYWNNNTYTIDSADTWEKKTITISGQTAAAINNDNGIGLYIRLWLAAGTDYSSGSITNDTWHQTAANRAAGQVNLADNTSNEWYLTGVQLEIGDVATPFEHEDITTTLTKCQRYFFRFQSDTAYDAFAPAYWLVTTQVYSVYEFPVTMRTQPSLAISATSDWRIHSNGGDGVLGSLIANRSTPNNMQTYSDQSSNTGTAGHAGAIRNNNTASAYIEFSAEL